MKSHTPLVLLCCVSICVSASAAPPLTDRLPHDCLAYVGWAGRSLPFDGSVTGQMIQDPCVGRVLSTVYRVLQENVPADVPQEVLDHTWKLLGLTWQRPIALALVPRESPEQQQIPFSVALLVDLAENRQLFQDHLDAIIQGLGQQLPLTEKTISGISCRVLTLPAGDAICFAFKDDLLLVTLGEQLIGRLSALTPAEALSANKKFIESRRGLTGDNEQISFWLDVGQFAQQLEAVLSPGASRPEATSTAPTSRFRRILDALGLAQVTTLAGTVRIVDYGMYTKMRVASPAPHRGVLRVLSGVPLEDQDLSAVPDDADVLVAARISPRVTYEELLGVLRRIEPGWEKQLLGVISQMEEMIGISVTGDILSSLGDTSVLCSAASQGGFMTGTVLTVTVKDSAKLAGAIAKIEDFVRKQGGGDISPATLPVSSGDASAPAPRASRPFVSIRTLTHPRTEIHYLSGAHKVFAVVAPAWAIHKDRLYFALWPQVVASAIDNVGKRAAPIVQDAQFRKFRARITGKPSVLAYVNRTRITRRLYPLILVLGTVGSHELGREMRLDGGLITPMALSKLESYIWPEVSAISSDERGIVFEAYGSQPSMAPVIPLAVGAIIPSLRHARSNLDNTAKLADLRMICNACIVHAADWDGFGPSSLSDEKLPPYLGFSSTSDPGYRKLIDDVEYIGRCKLIAIETPSQFVLVYRKPKPADKSVLTAFADSHSARIPIDEFHQLLQQSKQYVEQYAPPSNKDTESF